MKRLSIRWRLTLWYGGVLAGVLIIFGVSVFLLMRAELARHADRDLSHQAAAVEEQIVLQPRDGTLRQRLENQPIWHPDYEIQVRGPNGDVWSRSGRIPDGALPGPSRPPRKGRDQFEQIRLSGSALDRLRMVSRRIEVEGAPLLIQVAMSLAENDRQLNELLAALLLAGTLAVSCTLGGGYLLARQALAPVDRMTAAAEAITATQLDRRIEVQNPDDELGRLARTLNRMIERLGRAISEVRRFTADAAHELRTPLAILRNEAEVALRIPRESEQYQVCLENMLEEIDHLSRLSEALLFLFREDAGLGAGALEPLDLDDLVREVAEHMRVVAAERRQALVLDPLLPSCVLGNASQLRRLLINLVENAIKFTPEEGTIGLGIEHGKDLICLIVTDTGIGIAEEHLPRIFDRFYRVDAARSARTDGNGLGLSICRSIAEAHGGIIEVQSRPGQGTRVAVTLPAYSGARASRSEPPSAAALTLERSAAGHR